MTAFVAALQFVREHDGRLPPTLNSIQDKIEAGVVAVSDDVVQVMREEIVRANLVERGDKDIILCFVDGFLLYSDTAVVKELDLRLLVRAPYEKLKARREARSGYVTIEGTINFNVVYNRILERSAGIFRQDRLEIIRQRSPRAF